MTAPASPIGGPRVDEMPMLGLGTWQNEVHEQCARSVRTALDVGYRHIDTAQAYGNEAAVGDGLASADVDRDSIFLATKVWISNLGGDAVLETVDDSLRRFGTDYLDLLYVHWPAGDYDPAETLAAFDTLVDDGRIKRVGVSNFEPSHIDRARAVLDSPLFANQVELHPLLQQSELRAYAAEFDLTLVAYSPLIRGRVFDVPELVDIADKHGVSAAQVSLAWLREHGIPAIPKATTEAHIRDNFESLDLQLDSEDIERIDGIDRTDRQVHPGFGPDAWA